MSARTATALDDEMRLDHGSLDQLFVEARTHNRWLDRPVDEALLRELYDLAKLAPTSANSQPMRLVFVKSARGEGASEAGARAAERREDHDRAGDGDRRARSRVLRAAAEADAARRRASWFAALPAEQIERAAFQGSSMQGAYLILAARALGLDAGPIGGFDRAKVDAAFFPGGTVAVELSRQSRLRRSRRSVSAEPAPRLRRGVPDRLTG